MEEAYYNNTDQPVTVEEFLRRAGTDYAKRGILY
jgi:hypothetical protein